MLFSMFFKETVRVAMAGVGGGFIIRENYFYVMSWLMILTACIYASQQLSISDRAAQEKYPVKNGIPVPIKCP
jgi:hypothetical protein